MNTSVNLAGLIMKNPVIAASGTYGFGREYNRYLDLSKLGGISVKGLTLKPRQGNAAPRIVETPGGMLNSVGLQNPGVHAFIQNEIPFLRQHDIAIIANVAGSSIDEYREMAIILNDTDIDAMELNLSCPNVKEGCVTFGTSTHAIEEVTKEVRKYFTKPLFVKLTPNVTSIGQMASAAESAGADGISLINSLLGMAVDIYKRKPVLANNTGGLSGPAVKPVAVRMVHEVYNSVKIPIIGMGGITTGEDAVEFLLAGASAIMVGTANFANETACYIVNEGIEKYMVKMGYSSVAEITGGLTLN